MSSWRCALWLYKIVTVAVVTLYVKSLLLLHCCVVCFSQKFFFAACLCLSFFIWTNLSKQMKHWLLFVPLCFCLQALLLLKPFVVATDFLFKTFFMFVCSAYYLKYEHWGFRYLVALLTCYHFLFLSSALLHFVVHTIITSMFALVSLYFVFFFLFSDTKNPASKWLINDWLCYLA